MAAEVWYIEVWGAFYRNVVRAAEGKIGIGYGAWRRRYW